MKRMTAYLTGLAVALLLGACTTNKDFYNMQEVLLKEVMGTRTREAELKVQQEKTRTALAGALGSKESRFDAGGAAAVGVALALGQQAQPSQQDSSGELMKLIALQRPPESWEDKTLKWASLFLGGYKIYVDKEVGIAGVNANKDVQTALYAMVAQINRDTGSAVASSRNTAPTYQYNISDSNGVSTGGGSGGTYAGPMTLTCSSASGPGGDGATGGSGGAGGTSGVGGAGGSSGAAAASGPAPVTCTVTR